VDREDPVLDLGVPDALKVLRGAEPQVGGPDLHAELAAEEDRRDCPAAAEVQHPHAGPQVEPFAEPLGEPQRVGRAAHAGDHPVGVVSRRAGKPVVEQPLVGDHVTSSGRTNVRSSRLTRARALKHEQPSFVWPVC
jgi:hypothetical protein